MSLPTLGDLKSYVRDNLNGTDDTLLTEILDAATLWVNGYCARKFAVASTATARSFTPAGCTNRLAIDDCTSITSVVENGTTLSTSDYQKLPINAISQSGESVPYTALVKRTNWYYDSGFATVVVTAAWGWASIPNAVTTAILQLSKDQYAKREVEINEVSTSVTSSLFRYRRPESWGIG